MKGFHACIVCLLLIAPSVTAVASSLSPVTRVAELLQDLAAKIEKDGKIEEDLYEKYVCWAQTVIDTKTATNADATARIQELENYIADLDAGRIELSSERSDLEKEIAELFGSMEEAEAMRKKEHEDFLEAEDEMKKAITALEKAIEVLQSATEGDKGGALVQSRSHEALSFSAQVAEASALSNAADLGERFLAKADARFLRRLLTGDVPERADWKLLNRKATFKMSYKARSKKIQEVLAKMEATFEKNLKDAQDKEAEAQSTYDALMASKKKQKEAAEEALNKMEVENGLKGMTKEDALDEVAALKDQVKNDEKYIEQVKGELEVKKQEWKDRKSLRAGELEAISKTIAIIRSDDARDLFKKSFASQEGSFLQVAQESGFHLRKGHAAKVLQRIAQKAGDKRLARLAQLVAASGSQFDEVIEAIDKMVALLQEEETTDLENKQSCESDRMTDTREAAVTSRQIDELSDKITRLQSEIEELEKEIEANKEEIKKIKEQLAEAKKLREEEHAEWLINDKDDTDAAALMEEARGVLSEFYTENGLMLVQGRKQAPVVEAGKAPPPPPQTWDAPYGGKVEESTGILAIMEMIQEDIEKDKAKAKEEEDNAEKAYQKMKTESEEQIETLEKAIADMEAEVADKQEDITTAKSDITTLKEQLDTVMKKIKDAAPGCDFLLINYEMRRDNRQIEIDGLLKAKAILEGAEFEEGPDPNRELKPGDALLQRLRRK